MLASLVIVLLAVPQDPAPVTVKTDAKSVQIDGQFRFRFEYRDPVGYDTAAALAKNDDLLLSRLRLNFKIAVTDEVDVFAQIQDARTFGEEASVTSNEKNLDLRQGWVELRWADDPRLSLKIGRQEISYGDQRLISPLDWSNTARAFDGLKARYSGESFWVDGFFFVIREGTAAQDDQDFFGVYGQYKGWADHEVDLYCLGRGFANNAFTGENGAVGDLNDLTIGVRMKGRKDPVDYSIEIVDQTGHFVDDSIRALAYAVTFGWNFDMDWKPRLGVEVTWASGDADPTDGDHETFDPLFPFGHMYQGLADVFAWRNGRDISVNLKASPFERFTLNVDGHLFTLDERKDAWYSAAGTAIRRDASGSASGSVGTEIDVHARYWIGKAVKFWGGVSVFNAGKFVEDTGSSPDMLWTFLQMVVDF